MLEARTFGFVTGQRITVMVETMGDDHHGVEHRLPAGSVGIIESIATLPLPQGQAYAVWIPIDEEAGQGIVNVFDESDGPISHFIAVQE